MFALVCGIRLPYLLGHHLTIAGAVGFIALVGVSAGFDMIMLLHPKQAWGHQVDDGRVPCGLIGSRMNVGRTRMTLNNLFSGPNYTQASGVVTRWIHFQT